MSAATARVRMVRRVAETRARLRVRVESLEDEDIMVKCEKVLQVWNEGGMITRERKYLTEGGAGLGKGRGKGKGREGGTAGHGHKHYTTTCCS